eukprot:Gregarina_sp_Poly_1__4443@NODE_2395_length_2186_cov_440_081642_g1524_i0_p2_GENE_NODE_2395_length_2186_cov_440_081642_g1524_i0NODE_2395_length_2186_cov_440_081642_g1524_i0_p2_ORF_typecomplete_len151_score22_51UPF0139/PF03669_13/4e05_NODE_2395_length_2186_cov_440_081642_g1524_i063455
MFEDEPFSNEGKWEKVVEEVNTAEGDEDCFKNDGIIIDYKAPNYSGSGALSTLFVALPPLCTIASFMFQLPMLLYLCPTFVLSSWSLMRNGADKSQFITSVTCVGMSMFSHYMNLQRRAAMKVAEPSATD